MLFSSIFFFYALVLLQVQSEWFHLSGPEESSLMGAAQIFYSQVLFGLGEWGYSLLLSDYIVRAVLLLLSGGVFFLYAHEKKSLPYF